MENQFLITNIEKAPKESNVREFLNPEQGKKILNYHKSFPAYTKTPLAKLSNLAKELGVSSIYVKDESYRFGLNAFKVLGGSYSMGKVIAGKLGLSVRTHL